MDNFEEKKLKSTTIFKGKIITVVKDEVLISNGLLRDREVVKHNGGVVILAEKDDKILMVKQFRYPVGLTLWELPAGKLDKKNEDILDAAKRELEEETGHKAKNWQSLGFVHTSPGFSSEKLYLFFAKDLTQTEQNLDEGEILKFEAIEKNKVFEMIKNGEITDAKTICAVMKAYKL
ncbi:MAG: NUDIX hydrolase [Candidatus Gastranaerophilales bacterium]|nr:NUDIX hydrolase [Candidatus Gastranaerophilales bacterium]